MHVHMGDEWVGSSNVAHDSASFSLSNSGVSANSATLVLSPCYTEAIGITPRKPPGSL